MRAQIIGRILGVGVRVAGRLAGQYIAGAPASNQGATRTVSQTGRGVVRGLGGIFAPIRRVGGIVWLEVMGVFFLLPALIAASSLWKTRGDWRGGPGHHTFLASVVVLALFLYLSVSSFWRAGKK
jgi:hypothetical protein